MAGNFSKAMGGQFSFNQNLRCEYRQVRKENSLDKVIPNFNDKSIKEILEYVDEDFLKGVKGDDGKYVDYFETEKHVFYAKDGTSDSYVKRGLDHETLEYLDNQMTNGRSWRLETSNGIIDFRSGGKVYVGGQEWLIVKVINQLNTSTLQNSLWANPNPKNIEKYGTKLLVLV